MQYKENNYKRDPPAICKNRSKLSSEARGHQEGDSRGAYGGRRYEKFIRQNLGHPYSHKDAKGHPYFRNKISIVSSKFPLFLHY